MAGPSLACLCSPSPQIAHVQNLARGTGNKHLHSRFLAAFSFVCVFRNRVSHVTPAVLELTELRLPLPPGTLPPCTLVMLLSDGSLSGEVPFTLLGEAR